MPKNHIKMFCPLKPCTQRYTIIGYDTEDNGQGAPDNFLCCCFYNKDEQKTFTNKEEARQYLFSRKFPTPLFVAHNLAYDLNNLDYPYGSIETLYAKSRMIGATYKKGKYKVKHIDSGNFYIGTSIENLGMIIGFSKIKFDVIKLRDKIFMELPPLIASDMLKYCMRDAEITYRVTEKLQDMCAKYGVKLSCFTGASLALKIFRTKFLKISIKPRGKQINSYERLSYYGGRTEVFDYNRHPKVSYIDINSSYPFQMKTKKIPHPSTYEIRKNITQEELLKHHGIALITINIPKMRIPPLPYRTELKLLFPYGKITGCWTIPEIQLALDVGCTIETIHEAVIYYETIDLFSEYVDEFYTLKNSSYGIEKEFYKLLLNGLSGKFGERRTNTYRGIINNLKLCSCAVTYDNKIRNPLSDGWFCSKCNNVHIDGNDIDSMPKEDWISIQCSKSKDTTHTFPIIIAYITAHGRIQLYKQLIQAHSIYCDSINGNRFTTIKKDGQIELINIQTLFNNCQKEIINECGKEIKIPNDIEALTLDSNNKPVFKPILRLIRHKTNKEIIMINQKYGCSETTTDHSYITIKGETKPSDMDVYDMVNVPFIPQDKLYEPELCKSLIHLYLAYISDGSVSDRETSCRNLFSIAKDDKQYLENLNIHFEKVFGYKASIIKSSTSKYTGKVTYALRASRKEICKHFKELCGQGARNKKIPKFMFNLDMNKYGQLIIDCLKSGDGSEIHSSKGLYSEEHKQKHLTFCSGSLELICGIDLLLKIMKYKTTIRYRSSKDTYTIVSSDKYNTRNTTNTIPVKQYNEYVYDIEIAETHTFVDSCGHILLHNTDSVVGLNDNGATLGNELGEWKEDILYDFKALLPKVYNAKTDKCKNRECPKYDTHHYHEINKIKGVPKQTTTEPYMIDVIRNSKLVSAVRYEFDRPLKLAEAIRRHTNPNKWIPDKKDITGIDTKRTQLPNGDSEPVYINDTRDIKCFDDLLRYLGEINDIE